VALPLRVLGLFAQQDLALAHVVLRERAGGYEMVVEETSLSPHRASIVLEKIRAIVLVEEAELEVFER